MTLVSRTIRRGMISRHWLLVTALVTATGYACSDDDDDGSPGTSGGRSGGTGGVTGGRSATGGAAPRGGGSSSEAGSSGASDEPGGNAGAGGSWQAGAGGETTASGGSGAGGVDGQAGTAGEDSGGAGGSAGSQGEGGAGGGVVNADPDVFRPTLLPMTAERVASLSVPTGFTVNVFASGLQHARMLATHGPHVYLTRPMQNDVLVMTDTNSDGVAETPVPAVTGLTLVHGIAFHEDNVYLATVNTVYRAAVNENGTFGTPAAVVENLPGGGQHPYRTLRVGTDSKLYISVGSDCDACPETNPENAAILRTNLDGTGREVFATGLRNTLGFGWHAPTGKLWGVDNGSDWRGDLLPPEELNQIVQGANYGWPYCFGKRLIDPVIQDPPTQSKAAYCAATQPSTLEDDAHGAPVGMVFYDGTAFPTAFRNNAFVMLHGSWNRFPPSGYKIAVVQFDATGTPVAFQDFLTGFLVDNGTAQFGRPTGTTVGPDGALLFSDDANGVVYRVQYAAQ